MVLAWSVDDDAIDLGISVHQALHMGGGAAIENHDVPAAGGGVVQHEAEGLFLCPIARGLCGWLQAQGLVGFGILVKGRDCGAIVLHEEHAAHDYTAHAAVFPGVEDGWVIDSVYYASYIEKFLRKYKISKQSVLLYEDNYIEKFYYNNVRDHLKQSITPSKQWMNHDPFVDH